MVRALVCIVGVRGLLGATLPPTSLFAARIHCGVAGRKISHQSARFTEVAAHYHLIYYTYSRRGDGGGRGAAAVTAATAHISALQIHTHARSFARARVYFLPAKYESAKCWTKLSVLTPPENQCGVREWMMYRIAFTSH